jgi:hypothetical protein
MTTTIQLEPAIALNADQFYTLCRQNPDLKFERSPKGELILMSPTGGETGNNNATLIARFVFICLTIVVTIPFFTQGMVTSHLDGAASQHTGLDWE